jgi:DNA-binding MarR family transcriptional regulator
MAFRLLVDDLHERLVERGWTDVREAYGFVLLAVGDRATSTTELAELLGVTKQAMSKMLDTMEAAGFVRRVVDDSDARVKVVTLAPRGRRLLAEVEAIYEELEQSWADEIGERKLGQVRAGLEQVLRSRHDGDLPRLRPT